MDGRSKVIMAILKLDKPFRPPHIGDITGLSPQLIRHHLLSLMDADIIEKENKTYFVKDKEGLFEELSNVTEKLEVSKMRAAGFIQRQGADIFNTIADTILWSRALDIPDSREAKDAMLKQIDDTITEYKRLRRYLSTSQRSSNMAAKRMKKLRMDEVYDEWTQRLRYIPTLDRKEWVAASQEIIDDELENDDA